MILERIVGKKRKGTDRLRWRKGRISDQFKQRSANSTDCMANQDRTESRPNQQKYTIHKLLINREKESHREQYNYQPNHF
jgi:hypothetical protein